jgi:hypothetical protein
MDLWQIVLSFIRTDVLLLVVFIWCLGMFLKKIPGFKREWLIPFILLFVSILVSVLYIAIVLKEGFTGQVIIAAIIQGVLIAALAVFGNETIKQYFVKRPIDNEKLKE